MNAIKPGTIKHMNKPGSAFKERENITFYLDGCRALGMRDGVYATRGLRSDSHTRAAPSVDLFVSQNVRPVAMRTEAL